MDNFKYILGVVLAFVVGTTLQAQTYNDTVRTNTWSVYVQGGISGFHGGRSSLYDSTKVTIAPDLNIGVKYNIKPWVRVGANIGYTQINAKTHNILSTETVTDNFMVGDFPTILTTTGNRIQNTNNADVLEIDLNADFNIMGFWPNRKLQELNIWAGVGVGYLHGWNHNVQTWAYNKNAIAQGEGYYNVFNHSYLESPVSDTQYDGLYIPISLSVEYDVLPELSLGLVGQYKPVPTKAECSPTGIWSVGMAIRYNFTALNGSRKQAKANTEELEQLRQACAEEKDSLKADAQRRIQELERALAACEDSHAETRRAHADSLTAYEALKRVHKEAVYSIKVQFEHGDTIVFPAFAEQLSLLAKALRKTEGNKILIIASTTTHGLQAFNQQLSDRRLAAVKEILVANGVTDADIAVEISLGERFMNESDECRRVLVAIENTAASDKIVEATAEEVTTEVVAPVQTSKNE